MESILRENETNDYNHEKKLSSKHINFMRNTWKNMDQMKKRKFKRIAHQKLKTDQEIKVFDDFLDNLDETKEISFKNQQGECSIPWLFLDIFVWTLAGLTFGICTIS